LRDQKEFELAIKDLEDAHKLLPTEADPPKLIAAYKEDYELEKRISKIMENSQTLKGKEFIDFLLNFQQKEVESSVKRKMPKFCQNDLTAENATKLR
jgi:hypothetical protein